MGTVLASPSEPRCAFRTLGGWFGGRAYQGRMGGRAQYGGTGGDHCGAKRIGAPAAISAAEDPCGRPRAVLRLREEREHEWLRGHGVRFIGLVARAGRSDGQVLRASSQPAKRDRQGWATAGAHALRGSRQAIKEAHQAALAAARAEKAAPGSKEDLERAEALWTLLRGLVGVASEQCTNAGYPPRPTAAPGFREEA